MHELSLVQSLLEQVLALVREHRAERVRSISVLVGPFSGVVAESFAFAFETLKREEPCLQQAELLLLRPDPRYQCLDCGQEVSLPLSTPADQEQGADDAFSLARCPACASKLLSPLGGNELILQQIRME